MSADPLRTPTGSPVGDGSFDAFYYRNCCGKPYLRNDEWLAFFGRVADRIVSDIAPARVLDAGCALGLLVETLRDRGVEAVGIDLSTYAIEHVYEPMRPFCRQGSIVEPFDRHYDLIVAIEVLEHMPLGDAAAAIDNLCAHTDDVVFSSSPDDLREPTHVNVHMPGYWAEQFARRQFYRDLDFDASFITPWAVRFRRSGEPFHRLVHRYERRSWEDQHARDEARAYARDVQARLDVAEREREEQRAAASEAAREREEARAAEAAAGAAWAAASSELRQARQTIADMERSLFWRARRVYVRVRTALGFPG